MSRTSFTWWRNVDVNEMTRAHECDVTLSSCCREKIQNSSPRDVTTQFAGFESGGLVSFKRSLPFADPWCKEVEKTSDEGVETAGPLHHLGSDCTVTQSFERMCSCKWWVVWKPGFWAPINHFWQVIRPLTLTPDPRSWSTKSYEVVHWSYSSTAS